MTITTTHSTDTLFKIDRAFYADYVSRNLADPGTHRVVEDGRKVTVGLTDEAASFLAQDAMYYADVMPTAAVMTPYLRQVIASARRVLKDLETEFVPETVQVDGWAFCITHKAVAYDDERRCSHVDAGHGVDCKTVAMHVRSADVAAMKAP